MNIIPPEHAINHKNLSKRPNGGRDQVRTPQELRVGYVYLVVHTSDKRSSYYAILLKGPFSDAKGQLKCLITDFPVMGPNKRPVSSTEHYCADLGIIPRSPGVWDQDTYLLRTGYVPLSEKEINNLIQRSPLSH